MLIALLDWLLDSLFESWEISDELSPREQLLALIRLDLRDAYQDEQSVAKLELFFAYWNIAVRDPAVRERIRQAIERSRQAFLPAVQALIESEPARFHNVTPEGLVTVIVGIAQGCAMQSLLDDNRVDLEQILTVIRALLITYPANTGM